MTVALEEYINKWYESGGNSFFYFNLNCRFGKFGYWGLTEDARYIDTPKYRAIMNVSSRLNQQRAETDPAPAP
jgi:hypothetical protein